MQIDRKLHSKLIWLSIGFGAIELYYLISFTFVHKTFQYHWAIIQALFFNFVAIVWSLRELRYKTQASLIFYSIVVMGWVLIYAAGCTKAPAPFALALIPIGISSIFNSNYIKSATIGSLFLYLLLVLAEQYYPPSANIIMNYEQQKIANTIVFILACSGLIKNYTRTIESHEKEIIEKNDQIDNLLRTVIHDIATPLMVSRSFVQRRKHLDKVEKHLKTIEEIVYDVKKLRVSSYNEFELNISEVNIKELIEELLEIVEEPLSNKELSITIDSNLAEDFTFKTDPTILKNNILLNLVNNAIKFTPRNKQIKIKISIKDENLQLQVKDQGIGIPSEMQKQLFNNRKNLSRKGTENEPGTGFGLPIVASLVRNLKGEIKVESTEGQGSNFKITLPVM